MDPADLTAPYEPNPALLMLYKLVFDPIKVETAWVSTVRDLAARGVVVYVLRSRNLMDFLALDHLTKRHDLPRIRFVNDLGLGALNPSVGRGYRALLSREQPEVRLRATVLGGGSAVIFLKRPPRIRDVATSARVGRGRMEDEALLRTLLEQQRGSGRPILLLPQVFVWTRRPDSRGAGPLDFVLGPREWPNAMRTAGQLLRNLAQVQLRVGEPLALDEFLAQTPDQDDPLRVRRITYTMLRRLERERRSVTGPAEISPERARDAILRTPKLQSVIAELAGERPEGRSALDDRARTLLKNLQATPQHTTLQVLTALFHHVFDRIYAGIDYEPTDIQRVREASKDHTLILLPSHKSHVDYLILHYVFQLEALPLPVVAAGDNLNFFPLGPIMRQGGAFFIRRSFKGDRLYAAVVDAYVRRLLRDGYPIELFLEGGRSRTGKLLAPKFGLLGMIVEAALGFASRPVCFVPISIGYERLIEAASYEQEMRGGEKVREDAAGLLETPKVLRHRYGRINLQFGRILQLDEVRDELGIPEAEPGTPDQRRALVSRIANQVMDEINRVTAVTPGALVALSLLCQPGRGVSHQDLYARCNRLLRVLQEVSARVSPAAIDPGGTLRPQALLDALQMFIDTDLVEARASCEAGPRQRKGRIPPGAGACYHVPVGRRLVLDTSKNIIVHFFTERALMAIAWLAAGAVPLDLVALRGRVLALSRLLKHDFRFRATAPFDAIFDQTWDTMVATGEFVSSATGISAGPGRLGWTGLAWLRVYASILRSILEGYRVAARGLTHLAKGGLAEKEWVRRTLATGIRMLDAGEIEHREAVSKPLLQNALLALRDEQYLESGNGKLELAQSFRSPGAVRAVEGRFAAFLEPRVVP